MKETEVGEVRLYSDNEGGDVDLKISIVDWGKRHSVAVRLSVEGPSAGFYMDLTDDVDEVVKLLEAARFVRLGVVADRYDKPKKAAAAMETAREVAATVPPPTLAAVQADLEEAFGKTIFSFPNGAEVVTTEEFVTSDGANPVTIPAGAKGTVVGANDTQMMVKLPIGPPQRFGEEPRVNLAVLWVDPKHLELAPGWPPEFNPEAPPARPAPAQGDVVLSSDNIERGILIGTKGVVAEVSEAGLLTIDWETPMGTRRRQDVDPSTVSVARPIAAPIRARTEDDDPF